MIGSVCFVVNVIILFIFIGCLLLFNNSDNILIGLRLVSLDKFMIVLGCVIFFNVFFNFVIKGNIILLLKYLIFFLFNIDWMVVRILDGLFLSVFVNEIVVFLKVCIDLIILYIGLMFKFL